MPKCKIPRNIKEFYRYSKCLQNPNKGCDFELVDLVKYFRSNHWTHLGWGKGRSVFGKYDCVLKIATSHSAREVNIREYDFLKDIAKTPFNKLFVPVHEISTDGTYIALPKTKSVNNDNADDILSMKPTLDRLCNDLFLSRNVPKLSSFGKIDNRIVVIDAEHCTLSSN